MDATCIQQYPSSINYIRWDTVCVCVGTVFTKCYTYVAILYIIHVQNTHWLFTETTNYISNYLSEINNLSRDLKESINY